MCVVIILPTWQQKKSLHQKKDFPVIPNTNKVRYMHDPISIYNNLVSDDVMEYTEKLYNTLQSTSIYGLDGQKWRFLSGRFLSLIPRNWPFFRRIGHFWKIGHF